MLCFFIDKKQYEEDISKAKRNKIFNEVKMLFIYIRQSLPKLNWTIDKLFNYLDKNNDNYIDKNEFIYQMNTLPNFDNQKTDYFRDEDIIDTHVEENTKIY